MTQTSLGWIPSELQLEAIDLLATGYSMNAVARTLDVPLTTLHDWIHINSYSARFTEMIQERTAEFQAAKQAVHDQQVVMALQVLQEALSGEMRRERVGDSSETPLRYEAAIQLLRGTFWKQVVGGHKAFGAP